MDDPREFLEEDAAAEEPEVFGHLRVEMTRIRASLPGEGTPPWGCRESPERGGLSQRQRIRRLVD